MLDTYDTQEYKGYTIKVLIDDTPFNPRENNNFGTMVCFHGRYDLGDKHNYDSLDEALTSLPKGSIVLPLYLYDHNGINIATGVFGCQWDSGQVGFIYISSDTVRKQCNVKRISAKLRARVIEHLIGEVKEYDYYLTGEVYGYITEDKNGEEVDSCWGFVGATDYLYQDAKNTIDYIIRADYPLFFQKGKASAVALFN